MTAVAEAGVVSVQNEVFSSESGIGDIDSPSLPCRPVEENGENELCTALAHRPRPAATVLATGGVALFPKAQVTLKEAHTLPGASIDDALPRTTIDTLRLGSVMREATGKPMRLSLDVPGQMRGACRAQVAGRRSWARRTMERSRQTKVGTVGMRARIFGRLIVLHRLPKTKLRAVAFMRLVESDNRDLIALG
ncbi:hypothetical protein CPB85DRAFT_1250382 [Mucidula mucida]|nr:hypothetical protein CPB85DRAFT_1250382 [Mucidula mucida]